MAKKSKSQKAVEAKKEAIITMKALQEQSDSDDDGDDSAWPPESEWNAEATALRKAIEAGTFDTLLQQGKKSKNDDDASFEEVDLEDEDDDEDDSVENVAKNQTQTLGHGSKSNNQDVGDEEEDEEVDDESDDEDGENIADEESEGHEDDMDDIEKEEELELDDELEDDNDEDDADDTDGIGRSSNKSDQEEEDDDDDDESESDDENDGRFTHSNSSNQALKIVLGDMIAEKRDWPWAETFSVITSTPLPFDDKKAGSNILAEEPLRPSIHDDLQREVAFYNLAVEAAEQVKVFCREAQVPFSRPDDFLAEMVKTDDHMAKVKDRLIFETKKMEAVAQRKSNKEQKLRSKESHSNKLAEKAKKKRDHFQAVEAWAESAQANRGRGLADRDEGNAFFQSPSKKRARADEKFGRGGGGQRGRFKQNDPKALNDMSSFNRRGNFGGIGTKKSAAASGGSKAKTGSGANRKGKRARDASRCR